ncbi:MAG: multicopper oxidase domain-containing protein [Nocardioides sp.]|uniref:multicopper oxidase domain-containing protein n=1 Tax=Nocardioides sp. TaxID=35761 RepID=UPI00326606B4
MTSLHNDTAAGGAALTSATIVINKGAIRQGFTPKASTMSQDGSLTIVNVDVFNHTITSVAVDAAGKPLFDVFVRSGATVTIQLATGLAAGQYPFYCRIHPNMRGTLNMTGTLPGEEPAETSFDQPLVVPKVLTAAHPRMIARKRRVRVLPTGPRTPMWTYGGTWPGPTIRRPTGQRTRVTIVNQLPRTAGPTSVHLHGDHHASKDDGQPTKYPVRQGQARTYNFPLKYDSKPEPSSFFFYHDHRMDRTSLNNWRGLQGMFIVDDPAQEDLRLPTGKRDVPLLIADRSFRADNSLTDPFSKGSKPVQGHGSGHGQMATTGSKAPPNDATVGTHVLANGRFAPYLSVKAVRYRFRLLNGSNFTSYNFALSNGRPFVQIGTGNGLLRRPIVRQDILLGPSQRVDVIVDFHGLSGQDIVLKSVPRTDVAPDEGTGTRVASIMQFRVGAKAKDPSRLPRTLPSQTRVKAPNRIAKTWAFDLGGSAEEGTFWGINNRPFDPDRVDHKVRLGDTEAWRLRNDSDLTHYVHIHAEQWRTVSRNGGPPLPWERGLEDVWKLDPGEGVVVAARFEDYTGPFMVHCHMLDHEDHGMMATFVVTTSR